MSIQFLLVTCTDKRAVLADGSGVGFTNHTLMLPADEYVITLDTPGYDPPSFAIALTGTSLVKPMAITFATAAALPSAAGPSAMSASEAIAPGISGLTRE
jgi:hypothetical protein